MATPNRGDKTVNEFIKRLEEIKARASVIQKFSPDEITEDVKAELRALRSERSDLESKIEDAQILEELQADAPEVKAEEPAKEEEPAVEEAAPAEEPAVEPRSHCSIYRRISSRRTERKRRSKRWSYNRCIKRIRS